MVMDRHFKSATLLSGTSFKHHITAPGNLFVHAIWIAEVHYSPVSRVRRDRVKHSVRMILRTDARHLQFSYRARSTRKVRKTFFIE
jgi:hypothetical protein